jgi:hypothetical protein
MVTLVELLNIAHIRVSAYLTMTKQAIYISNTMEILSTFTFTSGTYIMMRCSLLASNHEYQLSSPGFNPSILSTQ